MKKSILIFAFVLLAFISGNAQSFQTSFSESFAITNPSNLEISSSDSSIEIVVHDKNIIEVDYSIKIGGVFIQLSKEELFDKIKNQGNLQITSMDNSLKIEMINSTKGLIEYQDKYTIDFKIYVPKQIHTILNTDDGNISLTGINGNHTCITNDGFIKLVNLRGNIIAKTNDADIIIDNVIGEINTETNDGNVITLSDDK